MTVLTSVLSTEIPPALLLLNSRLILLTPFLTQISKELKIMNSKKLCEEQSEHSCKEGNLISLESSIHKLGNTPTLYLNQVRLNMHENIHEKLMLFTNSQQRAARFHQNKPFPLKTEKANARKTLPH